MSGVWTEMRWRTGRKARRTIYAMVGEHPSDHDVLIGVMDTANLADRVVSDHNLVLTREASRGLG